MNLSTIKYGITSKASRQLLKTQKHSPKILFGIGLVGFGATVLFAARATLRLDELLDKHDQKAEAALTRRDLTRVYAGTAGQLVKLYGPTVVVGSLSVACLTGSHVVLTRRNVGLTAAYATVEKALNEYRAKVVDEYGAEVDENFMHGGEKTTETVIGEDGKKKKVTRFVGDGASMYARLYDPANSKYWKVDAAYNKLYILSQQSWANDKLKLNGHLFLNEVHDMLGMERTPEGQIVGWIFEDQGDGEGFVDFGLSRPSAAVEDFMRGHEASVLLDFNVQGNVWDKI